MLQTAARAGGLAGRAGTKGCAAPCAADGKRGFLLAFTSRERGGLASFTWAAARGRTMPPKAVCELRLHRLFSFCFCFWRIIRDLLQGAALVSPALSGCKLSDPNRLS